MSESRDDAPRKEDEKGGWESLEEEAAEAMAPSPELEDAMREAAEAVEARVGERSAPKGPKALAAELEAARTELEELKDRHLRLQADFENTRRRGLKQREEAHRYGHENLVKDLLGAVDNLERAIEHARSNQDGDFEGMLQGVELVHRELLGALSKHGVTVIEADGEPFDPEWHEAMAQEPSDEVAPGTVVQVFQKGYRLWDRLLRPARVVVSKAGEGAKPDSGEVA